MKTTEVHRTCRTCEGDGRDRTKRDHPCTTCGGRMFEVFHVPAQPARSLLHGTFKAGDYRPSNDTDVSRTFARIRRERRKADQMREEQAQNVVQLARVLP